MHFCDPKIWARLHPSPHWVQIIVHVLPGVPQFWCDNTSNNVILFTFTMLSWSHRPHAPIIELSIQYCTSCSIIGLLEHALVIDHKSILATATIRYMYTENGPNLVNKYYLVQPVKDCFMCLSRHLGSPVLPQLQREQARALPLCVRWSSEQKIKDGISLA